jgi:hypothetical protein
MPMVNGRWTAIQRGRPIPPRQLQFEYFYLIRRVHNKLVKLLQKNGHIKHDSATVEAIEQLLRLICVFVDKSELCVHISNPL